MATRITGDQRRGATANRCALSSLQFDVRTDRHRPDSADAVASVRRLRRSFELGRGGFAVVLLADFLGSGGRSDEGAAGPEIAGVVVDDSGG